MHKALPLIWPTLHKSFVFLLLLIVLNVLEEFIVGAIHHRAIADSLAEMGGGTVDQAVATAVVLWLVLVPLFAFTELGEIVGEQNLIRVFFYQRHSAGRA